MEVLSLADRRRAALEGIGADPVPGPAVKGQGPLLPLAERPPAQDLGDRRRRALEGVGGTAAPADTVPSPVPSGPGGRANRAVGDSYAALEAGHLDEASFRGNVERVGTGSENDGLYLDVLNARRDHGVNSEPEIQARNAYLAAENLETPTAAGLDARLDPAGRRDRATRRPIDEDETFIEGVGRALHTGVNRVDSAFSELAGQTLDAVGLDRAGEWLQDEAERERSVGREIPIGRQAVDSRERREQLRKEAEDRLEREGRPEMPLNYPGGMMPDYGGSADAQAFAGALREAPLETLGEVGRGVAESAPEMAAGLGLTALHPAAGAGFYAATSTGRQLEDAATDETTGARREVGAREGGAAVLSGLASAGLEFVADKLLLGRVADSMRATGLDDIAQGSLAREIGTRVRRVVGNAARQGRDEGLATEPLQTIIENVGAKYGWDPDQDVTEGLVDAIMQGAAGGVLFGGGGSVVSEVAGAVAQRADPELRQLAQEESAAAIDPVAAPEAVAGAEGRPVLEDEEATAVEPDALPLEVDSALALPATDPTVSPIADIAVPEPAVAADAADVLPALDPVVAPAADALEAPAEVPVRAEGEAFADYVGRAAVPLASQATTEIEAALQDAGPEADPVAVTVAAAERSENPVTVMRGWQAAREAETVLLDSTQTLEAAIADHLPLLDVHHLEDVVTDAPAATRRAYFRVSSADGGRTVDGQTRLVYSPAEAAALIEAETGMPVTETAVVDFVRAYPTGPGGYRASVRRPRRNVEARLRDLTGEPVSEQRVTGHLATLEDAAAAATPAAEVALDPRAGENPTGYGTRNQLVTQDAYRRALATLGQVAPFSNPQANPEMWSAAGQVAAFHAEALAREGVDAGLRFAEFSRRAVRDLGADFEPHLRSLFDSASTEVGDVDMDVEPAPVAAPAAISPADAATVAPDLEAGRVADVAPGSAQAASQGQDGTAAAGPAADAAAPSSRTTDDGPSQLANAAIERTRRALGLADLSPNQRQTWEATLEDVVQTGLIHEADAIAQRVVSTKPAERRPLSPREHVALLARTAEAQHQFRQAAAAITQAEADGLPTGDLQRRAEAALTAVDLLTRAGHLAGRDAGAALAIRGMRLEEADGQMTIPRVLEDARVLKGAALSQSERTDLAALAAKAETAVARRRDAEESAADRRRRATENTARRAVEREAERAERRSQNRERRVAALHEIREERETIKAELAALGYRVNDVTGLTAEASVIVGRLAFNYARAGAVRLEDVVARVVADLPDLSPDDVAAAIATASKPRRAGAGTGDKALDGAIADEARARNAVLKAQAELRPPSSSERLESFLSLPRSVLATGDMSAVGNQAAPLIRRHPLIAARTFADAFPTFFREADAERIDAVLRADDRQAVREQAGLYLAPLGDAAETASITEREETFASRLAEKSPWFVRAVVGAGVGTITFGPGVGTAVGAAGGLGAKAVMRASENHMVTFLNLLRARVFDSMMAAHPEATPEERQAYARSVNLFTGRGDLDPKFAKPGALLTFAPRLTAARFQAPYQIVKPGVPRKVRLQAAGTLAAFVGANIALLSLLDIAGGDEIDVGLDARSSDFGKVRWGSLRVDVWGGYGTVARLFVRGMLSVTDAHGVTETPADRREIDPAEELGRFANSKKAPWIGFTFEAMTGKTFLGEPTTILETAARSLTPLGIQTGQEAFETARGEESPAGRSAAAVSLSFFGLNSDAYDDPTARSQVIVPFERAHVTRYTSAPSELETDEAKLAFKRDFRDRLATKVEEALPELRRIAEPEVLAARLKTMKAAAREEAAGAALDDPLRQGFALEVLRRADDYSPSAARIDGMTDEQAERRNATFKSVMAEVIDRDRAALEAETDPDALRDRLSGLRRIATAELEGDPMAPDLELFVVAGYRPSASPPSTMPDAEHAAYESDWRRRLAARVAQERDALASYGDDTDGLKARLKWHAAEARKAARAAAGY